MKTVVPGSRVNTVIMRKASEGMYNVAEKLDPVCISRSWGAIVSNKIISRPCLPHLGVDLYWLCLAYHLQ